MQSPSQRTSLNRRKPWHNSLRIRLIAWYSLLAGVSMMISDGLLYFEFRQTLLEQVDNTLQILTIQATKNLDDELDVLMFDARENAPVLASLLTESGVSVTLLDQEGVVTEQFGKALDTSSQVKLESGFETIREANGRWRIYTEKVNPIENGRSGGWLRVGHSLRYMDETSSDVLNTKLFEIPFILIMVGLGGLFLANRALKPIDQITRTAERVRVSGDLNQRIAYQGADDELSGLASMFNNMLESLQKNFEREKRFTADTSHELRTPLTAIKGRLYVTLSQPRTVETYQKTLESIDQEVDRLIRLSSDLLILSQLEQQHLSLPLERVDLSDLLAAIAEQIEPLAEMNNVQLTTNIAPDLQINASPDHLIRLFLNLLDNAVKHTPVQGKVSLSTLVQGPNIQVQIRDTGAGIAAEHLSHLFERFYQVEKARAKPMRGTGLGLAIAQEIAEHHRGTIEVQSQIGEGTTFRVTLPKVDSITTPRIARDW